MGYKCFKNDSCEFFPCHTLKDKENFNCLFCFCPLYSKGELCGGNFKILEDGTKDCSHCNIPHQGESGYDFVLKQLIK